MFPTINTEMSCNIFLTAGPITSSLDKPYQCAMGDPKCNQVIALWGVGLHGECLNKDMGIPFGATKGYKKAMIQVCILHFNF